VLADGRGSMELALPDSAELAGRSLTLRAAVRDPRSGGLRWTDELSIVVAGER